MCKKAAKLLEYILLWPAAQVYGWSLMRKRKDKPYKIVPANIQIYSGQGDEK